MDMSQNYLYKTERNINQIMEIHISIPSDSSGSLFVIFLLYFENYNYLFEILRFKTRYDIANISITTTNATTIAITNSTNTTTNNNNTTLLLVMIVFSFFICSNRCQ